MSRTDIERWNRKYRDRPRDTEPPADALLRAHAALLNGPGLALDVACGLGQNSLFLARRGYRVLGVDGSIEALRQARAVAARSALTIDFAVVDLDRYRFPAARFDLVIMFRFLIRPLLPNLATALRPGGLMICQTYNRNRLKTHPDFNPEYLLRPGELVASFSALETIATNDRPDYAEPLSFWIGKRR